MNPNPANTNPLQKLIENCLLEILAKEIKQYQEQQHQQQQHQETEPTEEEKQQTWIVNFRDPTYSAEEGGYHPVEVMVSSPGQIHYITDFSYAGVGPYAELVKELDFELHSGEGTQMGMPFNLTKERELFKLFQQNFCHYYQMEVYQVEVNPLD